MDETLQYECGFGARADDSDAILDVRAELNAAVHGANTDGEEVEMRRRWLLLFLLGVVGTAVYGGIALATPPSGLTNVPLARGTNTSHGTIPLQFGTDVAMAQITVVPGGSSGWHSHPGGAIVVVKQGELTVYGTNGSQCQISTYSAGQAFIEQPGELDQVINTGSIPYVLYVTFPRVPQGDSARTDEADPGTCRGI